MKQRKLIIRSLTIFATLAVVQCSGKTVDRLGLEVANRTLVDSFAPTQTALPANGALLGSLTQVDITYSEPVQGAATVGNYVWSGAGLGSIASASVVNISGNTFRLTVTGLVSNGALVLTIQNIVDAAGNPLNGNTITYTGNTINPTQSAGPISGTSLKTLTSVAITYSAAVLGAGTLANYSVANAPGGDLTLSSVTGPVGNVYTLTLGGTTVGNGTATITIAGVTDLSLLPLAGNTISYTADTTAPTLLITTAVVSPTNASPFSVTFTFNENVTGFVIGDITAGNASVSNFVPISGTQFTADITPTASGAVTVDVAGAMAQDAAGNNNTAAAQLSRTYDNVVPTVSLSSTAVDPTNVTPIPLVVTFSKAVTGFTSADITVGNGTAGVVAGGPSVYTVNVTPSAVGAVTVDVAAGIAQDTATNGNAVAVQLSRNFDNQQPTVTLSSTATEPTNASPFPLVVTFSKPVTGFASADITVGNGTAGVVSGGPSVYTANITPTAQGAVTVNIAAGVAQDSALNNNLVAVQLSRTYDTVQPTVVLSSTAPSPTNTSPIPVVVTFNESVTGFAAADITVGNGTAGAVTGGPAVYNVSITPTGQGAVTIDVAAAGCQDLAGNNNSVAAQISRTYDSTAATLTISSTAPEPTNTSPIPVTFTFNESVTGFLVADITVGNGTAGALAGGPAIYTVSVTPTGVGAVTIDVAAGAAQDAAGNNNSVATQLLRTYDTVAPTMSVSPAQNTGVGTVFTTVDVTYNETVVAATTLTNYVASGIGKGTWSTNPTSATLNGGGCGATCYRLVFSGSPTNGPLAINISNVKDASLNNLSNTTINYIGGWTKHRKLTIDNSAQAQNLMNFPLLVRVDASRIDFANTQNSGQDIRFYDADGITLLPHEIEKWNEAGSSYVWVKVPQVDASSNIDFIWMYYGNATVADGQNATAVWDANFKGVWHLGATVNDSTANAFHATNNGTTVTTGRAGDARSFNGTTNWLNIGSNLAILKNATQCTVSAWIKMPAASTSIQNIFAVSSNNGGVANALSRASLALGNFDQISVLGRAPDSNGGVTQTTTGSPIAVINTWHHVATVLNYTANTIDVYVDGTLVADDNAAVTWTASATDNTNSASSSIGAQDDGSAGAFLAGLIDEVRVSNTNRSAQWISAQYKSMSDIYLSFGPEL